MLYFDHNATSPVIQPARDAWWRATDQFIGNPSSQHRLGTRADRALQTAREELAALIGCQPEELVFTSGATEASNTVLHHLSDCQGSVFISSIEHPAVLVPAGRYFRERLRLIPVSTEGVIDLPWLSAELRTRKPALVAVMAANNETGILQPWREIRDLCREFDVPVLCDASQWIGKEESGLLGSCDYVLGCGHKFGGPPGVGFLKAPSRLRPLLYGGPQEDGQRAGTENLPGILGMVAALCDRARFEPAARLQRVAWRDEFETGLRNLGARIIGTGSPRLWNTVYAVMPEVDCRHRWVVKLDKAGVAVSTGSACASGKEKPSHVLSAMGIAPEEAARVIRFSSGWETTEEEWRTLLERVAQVASDLGCLVR